MALLGRHTVDRELPPPRPVGAATAVLLTGAAPVTAANGWRYARAVDGDTIQLGNGQYVRLLGYDTPEVGS